MNNEDATGKIFTMLKKFEKTIEETGYKPIPVENIGALKELIEDLPDVLPVSTYILNPYLKENTVGIDCHNVIGVVEEKQFALATVALEGVYKQAAKLRATDKVNTKE